MLNGVIKHGLIFDNFSLKLFALFSHLQNYLLLGFSGIIFQFFHICIAGVYEHNFFHCQNVVSLLETPGPKISIDCRKSLNWLFHSLNYPGLQMFQNFIFVGYENFPRTISLFENFIGLRKLNRIFIIMNRRIFIWIISIFLRLWGFHFRIPRIFKFQIFRIFAFLGLGSFGIFIWRIRNYGVFIWNLFNLWVFLFRIFQNYGVFFLFFQFLGGFGDFFDFLIWSFGNYGVLGGDFQIFFRIFLGFLGFLGFLNSFWRIMGFFQIFFGNLGRIMGFLFGKLGGFQFSVFPFFQIFFGN